MTHPLTDALCATIRAETKDNWLEYHEPSPTERRVMRATADWQLEQVIKWFKESTSHYGGDCLYLYHLDLDEGIENVLRKAMRPQENN